MERRISLLAANDDDPEFIERIGVILDSFIERDQPDQVILIKIDNWFGVRWQYYSRTLRIPPFVPNRVVSQNGFRKSETEGYRPVPTPPVHLQQKDGFPYLPNAQRIFSDTLLVWYSGKSVSNDRGSLMICRIAENMTSTGYVSFARNKVWRLHISRGLLSRELLAAPI